MNDQPVTLETIAKQLDLILDEARLAGELGKQLVPMIETTNAQVGSLDAKLVAMGEDLTATIRSVPHSRRTLPPERPPSTVAEALVHGG